MLQRVDSVLRNRRFWFCLFVAAYVLPALFVGMPIALGMPLVLIPNADKGIQRACGLHLYGTSAQAFSIGFHLIFWPLCALLYFWGTKLPSVYLRLFGGLLLLILAMTMYGCADAIDAVRH